MSTHAYHVARITETPVDGGTNHTISLRCWSEDGCEEFAQLTDIFDPCVASNIAAFWQTGGARMIIGLLTSTISMPDHGPYDDCPDPSDIAEMECAYSGQPTRSTS